MALNHFHPIIADWFRKRFDKPTDVQVESWPAIASGTPALIAAPTGSGKTLAAFLTCIDSLFKDALACNLPDHTRVLYVSPLKALSNDVQKNLREPLAEISDLALEAGQLLPEIRVEVRTGDTPAKNRQHLLRHPPHILITTPESLFLLLTARKSREVLRSVQTVIIDEIHAVAGNKRGAHLALSLERLDSLTQSPPIRIGLSATQQPIEEVARFLVGQDETGRHSKDPVSDSPSCHIVDMGKRRAMDLRIEVPHDELGAVATNAIWGDIYDRLAALIQEHRSTLVFVNTRRLAERISHYLAERLGEEAVAAHHGSLSRRIRLSAEERLKSGQTRAVVATASLELGIDIGTVDLVCQIGSPRAIATGLQRIGRAGHWVGATPKGRLFCTTRDELLECAALVLAMRAGTLDSIGIPQRPFDILAQHMVAAVASQDWGVKDLFDLCRRAYPYRDLTWEEFEAILRMVAEGYVPHRRRQFAYLFHDRVHQRLRARRGARLAAITSGGAIPDTATYAVVAEPQGTIVGSVDEDFAVESLAGDIFLLGNASWRIRRVETGTVRVEDAHGAPPTIPFWRGEAPSRTHELSREVASLREHIARGSDPKEGGIPGNLLNWLQAECGLDQGGAEQAIAYVTAGHRMLGSVPSQHTVIAERFFDEAGGMQLVIHAPFGGRINRAWGLALRKRFCVSFDFELQAAATDEGLVISLGEKHSFSLDAVFHMLRSTTLRETLIQAVLTSPMFTARWRWNASRALALLRFQQGKKVPLHIQRMRAEELLTAIFPMATACQENHVGAIPIPDHPLVQETIKDCLEEAMDIEGLRELLARMEDGTIQCLAVEAPTPSPFSHEILNANPYAFLDDAPLEERRARAVNMRQILPPEKASDVGALDPAAIEAVVEEAWPVVRNPDDLQEALHLLLWLPEARAGNWEEFLTPLVESGRAYIVAVPNTGPDAPPIRGWASSEHIPVLQKVFPEISIDPPTSPEILPEIQDLDEQAAYLATIQGWMECVGPITEEELAHTLQLPLRAVQTALIQLESQGQIIRGTFRPSEPQARPNHEKREWCDRRLLARIHRRTITSLRREIEPVSAADFMRFLFRWQHVASPARMHGEAGLLEVLRQLAGFEAAASAWEPLLLTTRMANYSPDTLDYLCLRGEITWGRLTLPALNEGETAQNRRGRLTPTSLAPISVFPREEARWLLAMAGRTHHVHQALLTQRLSAVALEIYRYLYERGASFFADIRQGTNHLQAEVEQGLWELASAGLVTADGFDNLRALLDPKRRRAGAKERAKRPGRSVGRWSLLQQAAQEDWMAIRQAPDGLERWARLLLKRYGIVFRDVVKRESLPFAWRDLLVQYRRLELRGEIRGGRFVSGFTGEQFGLPDAIEALRAVRRDPQSGAQEIRLSGTDPLNLAGIILPGGRIPALPTNVVVYRDGMLVEERNATRASA